MKVSTGANGCDTIGLGHPVMISWPFKTINLKRSSQPLPGSFCWLYWSNEKMGNACQAAWSQMSLFDCIKSDQMLGTKFLIHRLGLSCWIMVWKARAAKHCNVRIACKRSWMSGAWRILRNVKAEARMIVNDCHGKYVMKVVRSFEFVWMIWNDCVWTPKIFPLCSLLCSSIDGQFAPCFVPASSLTEQNSYLVPIFLKGPVVDNLARF